MKINLSWPWNISFLLYIFVAGNSAARFFHPSSDIHLYYQVLTGFNEFFLIFFLLNALAIAIDLIAAVPFYVYIRPKSKIADEKIFSLKFWQGLFVLRIILLINGHAFAYKQIQSFLAQDLWITFLIVGLTCIFYAPSYYTHFRFAYSKK